MSNFFTKVLHGVEDVGKFMIDIPEEIPKVVVVCDDVKQDASTVIPELQKLAGDVGTLVKTGGTDAVQFIAASKILWPALVAAIAADGVNITLDLAVVSQIKPLITDGKDFSTVIPLFEPIFNDYETLDASVEADLAKLETDGKAVFAG